MATFTALTTLAAAAPAAALADALEALEPTGVGAFEIEDGSGRWEVGAYFDDRPDGVALDLLAAAYGGAPFVVSKLEDRDWVAQVRRELTPVRAGRFIVHGRHDRQRIPPNARALEIEAAMAFGTGHHATTEGCLLAIDHLARRGLRPKRVADIGCGTGVLAMAAAKTFPAPIVASDIDAVAVATARANFAANAVRGQVTSALGPGARPARVRDAAPYDLILANILAGPLRRLAPALRRIAAPGAVVVLAGLLDRQARSVQATYAGHGFNCIQAASIRGWTVLTFRLGGGFGRPQRLQPSRR